MEWKFFNHKQVPSVTAEVQRQAQPLSTLGSAALALLWALAARAITAELSPGLTACLCHGEWMWLVASVPAGAGDPLQGAALAAQHREQLWAAALADGRRERLEAFWGTRVSRRQRFALVCELQSAVIQIQPPAPSLGLFQNIKKHFFFFFLFLVFIGNWGFPIGACAPNPAISIRTFLDVWW